MNSKLDEMLNPLKKDLPAFNPGDTVRLTLKIIEADAEKTQHFEGIVIKKHGSGASETLAVRKISFGVGIERTFHLHSPNIMKIEIVSKGSARRAKLYYLRKKK